MEYVNGLDVSVYQGRVTWSAVRSAGYSFAIARATEGALYQDPQFARNITGIRAAGMVAGAYHYLSWLTPAKPQAASFLRAYKPIDGDLPPMLDIEDCTVGAEEAIAQISAFLAEVEPHLNGAKMLLYMSLTFPDTFLAGGSDFSGHPLNVAAYNSDPEPTVPAAWAKATMWQWSDKGRLPGISGNVDLDRFVGTLDELKAFTLKGIR
jgi:GH25 family lysozyme M1 (1,4-beta-N-acetylmuramidase)